MPVFGSNFFPQLEGNPKFGCGVTFEFRLFVVDFLGIVDDVSVDVVDVDFNVLDWLNSLLSFRFLGKSFTWA